MKPTITLAGICCDHNSSYLKGCAEAPSAIRKSLHNPSVNRYSESGIHFNRMGVNDIGDHHVAATDEGYLEIESFLLEVVNNDSIPLILGGDHAITYPVIRALRKVHGSISILHLDAHPDLYENFEENRFSHACPFARIMEEKLASQLIQVGIRTATPHQLMQAQKYGVEMYQMKDFSMSSFAPVIQSPLYISLDLDVLDPAFAPGVSHYEPGGLSVREVISIIQRLQCPVIGADIVEYNPSRDIQNMTGMVAAKLLKEIASKITEQFE